MKVLVAGWFSFPGMGATAGDLLTRDVVGRWLEEAGRAYDVAVAPPFEGGVAWQTVDPNDYSTVVFVCGPFGNGWPIPEFLGRFAGRRLIGVNLSMLESLDVWNPFDLLLERDSSSCTRPDLAFLATPRYVPIAGVVLAPRQKEYSSGAHDVAHAAIEGLIAAREMVAVRIDTRLDVNTTGLRTAAEVESLVARTDVVLTTRLHGIVLALRSGVPAVAIDPIPGGAKVLTQARTIGWPAVLTAPDCDQESLRSLFEWALTAAARVAASECRARARAALADLAGRFESGFYETATVKTWRE